MAAASCEKPSLDGGVGVLEEGPQDAPGLDGEHGMDAAQPLGPGAAQEFMQHRLRLVVQGVGGGDCVHAPSTINSRKKA